MKIPHFNTRKELYGWLTTNKNLLVAQKKAATKFCDPIQLHAPLIESIPEKEDETAKAISDSSAITGDTIKVVSVINTTLVMDSHKDVHLNNIWKKSLTERKSLYLLKEHKLDFDNIITDDVKAKAETRTWKELGYNAEGTTQALVFYSTISKGGDTPYPAAVKMFDFYRTGKVKNHSVGMQYVSMSLAINDADYKEEKAVWDKYIDKIVNRAEVEEGGYFWAIHEAKVIEGSAVPIGSNTITPTLAVEEKSTEPDNTTQENKEPEITTPKQEAEQQTNKVKLSKLTENFSL
jgi:hypothetical protein